MVGMIVPNIVILFTDLDNIEDEAGEELISRLQVIEAVAGHVCQALWPRIAEGAKPCVALTRAKQTALRHMAARALAAMAARDPHAVMQTIVTEVNVIHYYY